MDLRIRLFISVIAVILISGIAKAEGTPYISVPAIEDARVESYDHAAINYGNDYQIRAGNIGVYHQRSYLKFDLSAYKNVQVNNVDLVLTKIGGFGTFLMDLNFISTDSWSESTITYNNQPAITQFLSTVSVDSTNGEKIFDVTTAAKAEISGDGILTIMIRGNNELNNPYYKLFASSENPNGQPVLRLALTSNKPQITTKTIPASINEGQSGTISFSAEDPDNNIASYSISIDDKVISQSNSTTWNTDFMDAGSHAVKLYVEDTTGLNDTYTATINVVNVQTIVLNEFLPYPLGGQKEWIELYNPASQDYLATNCEIDIGTIIISINGVVGQKAYAIIPDLTVFHPHEGDLIWLKCNGKTVDQICYGSNGCLAPEYKGLDANALPLPVMGKSFGRKTDGLDTDIDKNDFISFSVPSPGTKNNAYHAADANQDGCISMQELLNYVGLWKADPIGIGMSSVLDAVGQWKANPVC